MTEIRSFRRVFELERRIYSVDQLRLNPGGIPVRGVAYFLALLVCELIVGSMPGLRLLAAHVPWYLRDIALPAVTATMLSAIRVEGRASHLAAHALVRFWISPRRIAGGKGCRGVGSRWYMPEFVMLPDGSDSRLRRLRYTGPGAVLVCVEHVRGGRALERGASAVARRGSRRTVTLREPPCGREAGGTSYASGGRAQVITLGRGVRLVVRPAR
jgi:hypothetical protein